MSSPLETFLTDFHNTTTGLTSKALSALPVTANGCDYGSTYEILTGVVEPTESKVRILDLACGDGYLLSQLHSAFGSQVTLFGVDISNAELSVARSRLPTTATLQISRAQHLPHFDDSLDYVLSHMALMLFENVESVVAEIARVLKPGATFAAIVGAPSPQSAGLSVYLDCLKRYPRLDAHIGLRFGDKRTRSREGIEELLTPQFTQITIDDIPRTRRFMPEQLWLWFQDMYDLSLIREEDRAKVKHDFLAEVAPHRAADGQLEYYELYRFVRAEIPDQ